LKKPRYSALFDLEITDYKGWAKGLKKAGYATNPKYPQLLITIIEDNELHRFDEEKYQSNDNELVAKNKTKKSKNKLSSSSKSRKIKTYNRVKYIVVKKGDTFAKISKDLGLMSWQLTKYNETTTNAKLVEGQKLYIQPKRSKADKKYEFHKVKSGDTMYSISQKYGIKLDKLYKKNLMAKGNEPKVGNKIWLRKQKK
jgi:LysM repeat protein